MKAVSVYFKANGKHGHTTPLDTAAYMPLSTQYLIFIWHKIICGKYAN